MRSLAMTMFDFFWDNLIITTGGKIYTLDVIDILGVIIIIIIIIEKQIRIHTRERERGSNTKAHRNSTQKPR